VEWLDALVARARRALLGISAEEIRYTFEDVRSEVRAVRAELRDELARLRRELGLPPPAEPPEPPDDEAPVAKA
jgi:outer membrane protein TolC